MNSIIYLIPVVAIVSLLYALVKSAWINKQDAGNDRMKEIAAYISQGAMSFLKAEFDFIAKIITKTEKHITTTPPVLLSSSFIS